MRGFVGKRDRNMARRIVAAMVVALFTNVVGADSRPSNQIRDVRVNEQRGKTTVTVVGSKRPSFTAFRLKTPKRLVIDIANSQVRGVPSVIEQKTNVVEGVAISEYSVKGVPVSRVMINFLKDTAYRVRVKGNRLVVSLNGAPDQKKEHAKNAGDVEARIVKAQTQAEEAKRLRDEAKADALAAKKSLDEARKELTQYRKESVERQAEVEKAKKEAKIALSRLSKAQGALSSNSNIKETAQSQKLALAGRQVKEFRSLATKADAQARQEKEKRIALERRLTSLNRQLDLATQSKNKAEVALVGAESEAEKLKKEAREGARLATSARKEANQALNAQREAAEAYRKAAQGEREKYLSILKKREGETVEAKQKVANTKQSQSKTEAALINALRELKKARHNQKQASHEQKLTKTRTDKELAKAKKLRLEAEKAASVAEQRAEKARIARQNAEQKVVEIQRQAKKQNTEARQNADAHIQAAMARIDEAEVARKMADKQLGAAKKRLAESKSNAKNAKERSLVLAKKLTKAEEDARHAKKQSGILSKKLMESEKNARRAEERFGALSKKLMESESQATREKERTSVVEKDLAKEKERTSVIEEDLAKARDTIKSQEKQLGVVQEKLTQEELRLKRLAEMSGNKAKDKEKIAVKAKKAPQPMIKDIQFETDGEFQKVVIKADKRLEYSTTTDADGNAVIVFQGVRLAPMLERVLDVTDFGGIIGKISSFNRDDRVHVEVHIERTAFSRVTRGQNQIEWVFSPKKTKPNLEDVASRPYGTKSRTIAREDSETYAYPYERTAGLSAGAIGKKKKRYTGRHIDLDFKDADIHNILRLLADVGHVNVITSDEVKGTVTIRMRDVAWDHALDVVLQAKKLGMVREGNLIRVAPLSVLEKEMEMEIARRKQKMELEPIETRLIPISYASAAELQPRANDLISERGTLSVDARTNVIIARDTKNILDQIEALIRTLDTQTPQVLIESRIVEATSTYAREIGIQWGGDFAASSATGNPTGLAFPSSIGMAGGATDNQTPVAGLSPVPTGQPNPNFGVNLPAAVGTGSGGALGITLGSISNNANLNFRLSSLEESGTLRILSSPRILTLDNREAHIEQGTSIPYSQVSAQGVQTAFKDAKLALTVKPHVTADGSILLSMKVERDEPDFNNTGARGDPTILKRQANTELLVSDGHTAVIGGIFTRNHGSSFKKVPFFADIPVIGWLFKSKSDSDRRSEMLIFITPRIVNRAESIGQ